MAEGCTRDELSKRFASGPHVEHVARAAASIADAMQAVGDDEMVEESLYGDLVDICEQYGLSLDEVTRLAAVRAASPPERNRVLEIVRNAETKSAGADVIVADAEARRAQAETSLIAAQSRIETLERENAALSESLGLQFPWRSS